jgi:hypothetical protein
MVHHNQTTDKMKTKQIVHNFIELPPQYESSDISSEPKKSLLPASCWLLNYSSTLKMKVARSSKVSLNIYQTRWCYISEGSILHFVTYPHSKGN